MDKLMQLRQLTQGLREAGRGRDWAALSRLDAELAATLRRWPAPVQLSEAERQALQGLKQAHAQSRELCAAELASLTQTLQSMRQGRERWSAYAESAGWSDSAHDPEVRA